MGAGLLTMVLTQSALVHERSDVLEFLDHLSARHVATFFVSLDRYTGAPAPSWRPHGSTRTGHSWMSGLLSWQSNVLVPLVTLDRHSNATAYVRDEAGDLVSRVPDAEIDRLLCGGLVTYAAKALGGPTRLPRAVEDYIREQPLKLASLPPDRQVDEFFTGLNAYPSEARVLFLNTEFRVAVRVILATRWLVVPVDPSKGPHRIFTTEFRLPLTGTRRGPFFLRWALGLLRSGTIGLDLPLGTVGGCARYILEAEAPFDARFGACRLDTSPGGSVPASLTIASTLLTCEIRGHDHLTSAVLHAELMAVKTGVMRAAPIGAWFFLITAIVGFWRVYNATDNVLLSNEADAGVSLLLLAPGIAASALATPARHTLTATLQFPTRVLLWVLGATSFFLAGSTALKLTGGATLAVWGAAVGLAFVTVILFAWQSWRLR